MEIYLGKGKITGIYGDPAKEILNKLTPERPHQSSLIGGHSVAIFEPEMHIWDILFFSHPPESH